MVYWNGYCLYAMMCFTSPLLKLNSEDGFCSFFKSEDVDKKSMVIDVSKFHPTSGELWRCMRKGPYNTILIYLPDDITGHHPISFMIDAIEYDHLIVLNEAMPKNFAPHWGKGELEATSLTVFKNSNLIKWAWLKNTKFKYIRVDSCTIDIEGDERIDQLILTDRLLTLTLVKMKDLNPFTGLDYDLAPNLRELSINHFDVYYLDTRQTVRSKSLERLNLANNRINKLKENFAKYMPKLQVLILEGNELTTIYSEFIPPLRGLLLDDNPIEGNKKNCEYLLSSPIVQYKKTGQICRGRTLTG
ncbi:uncharacterized protein LOC141856337 [Brevipalpus obovatus]|uniref:uncharacterized protein LOC141856337 n=1 Tax=Brevipalpus obovatus TaxID=246614 RepID=UPI003D9E89EA